MPFANRGLALLVCCSWSVRARNVFLAYRAVRLFEAAHTRQQNIRARLEGNDRQQLHCRKRPRTSVHRPRTRGASDPENRCHQRYDIHSARGGATSPESQPKGHRRRRGPAMARKRGGGKAHVRHSQPGPGARLEFQHGDRRQTQIRFTFEQSPALTVASIQAA